MTTQIQLTPDVLNAVADLLLSDADEMDTYEQPDVDRRFSSGFRVAASALQRRARSMEADNAQG